MRFLWPSPHDSVVVVPFKRNFMQEFEKFIGQWSHRGRNAPIFVD